MQAQKTMSLDEFIMQALENNYSLKMKTKNVPGQNSYCQKTVKELKTCFCFHCVKEMNWRANNFVEEKIAFEG